LNNNVNEYTKSTKLFICLASSAWQSSAQYFLHSEIFLLHLTIWPKFLSVFCPNCHLFKWDGKWGKVKYFGGENKLW
jgi:hypothetical protein